MKCRIITDSMRTRIDQMVKTGAFDGKSVSSDKGKASSTATKFKKKGAVNAVVKEEDNGEETEVEDDELPTREHLL